jgi:hypothetical protein
MNSSEGVFFGEGIRQAAMLSWQLADTRVALQVILKRKERKTYE